MATKDISLNDIAQLISALDRRFEPITRDIKEIRLDLTRLNHLYEQIFGRVLGIENDIEEIYDRLVILEEKTPNLIK